jgi:hypothetical protein
MPPYLAAFLQLRLLGETIEVLGHASSILELRLLRLCAVRY